MTSVESLPPLEPPFFASLFFFKLDFPPPT
jgi:hypothetical protein